MITRKIAVLLACFVRRALALMLRYAVYNAYRTAGESDMLRLLLRSEGGDGITQSIRRPSGLSNIPNNG